MASAPAGRTVTLTATLRAARLEAGDAIQLVLSDPDHPSTRFSVTLADGGPRPLGERMRRARQAFAETFVLPSFEGFSLLYGQARLTIALGTQTNVTAAGTPTLGLVLDFTPLDGPAPLPWLPAPRHARRAGAAA